MTEGQLAPHIQDLIIKGMSKRKNDFRNVAIFFFVFAVILFPVVYYTGTHGNPLTRSLIGCAIVGVVGVPFLVAWLWRSDPTKNKALRLLRERPLNSIVWLFTFTTGRQGAGVSINIGFDDGTLTSVTLIPQDADEVFAALLSYAPHATQHFTEELARTFRNSPGSFPVAAS